MTPSELRQVTAAVKAGLTITDITRGTSEQQLIVNFAKLKRYRKEHPEFDRFIIENARDALSRSLLLHCRIVPANAQFAFAAPAIIRPVRKEIAPYMYQEGDQEWISSLIPRWLPHREDVVQNTFMDLISRAISREEVPAAIKKLVAEHKQLFPTKYRKFGDSPLLSLDELLFEDGSATRGDTVTHGLWD